MCGLDRVGQWAVVEEDGWVTGDEVCVSGKWSKLGNIGCGDVETLTWAYWCEEICSHPLSFKICESLCEYRK